MQGSESPAETVRGVIDSNRYMVLATADRTGLPWSSPVYFAHQEYREFFWLSSPQTTHSHNIGVRPQVGVAVFDSSVPISTGQGVYMSAVAEALGAADVERAIEVFSRRSLSHGGATWTPADVNTDTSGLRLYRAVAQTHWILAKDGHPDHRIPATLT